MSIPAAFAGSELTIGDPRHATRGKACAIAKNGAGRRCKMPRSKSAQDSKEAG
jgi:hypothetical protein